MLGKKWFIDMFPMFAFVVVNIGLVGATIAFLSPEEVTHYPYVGNSESKNYYEVLCINKVPTGSRVLFETNELALNNNYNFVECKKTSGDIYEFVE